MNYLVCLLIVVLSAFSSCQNNSADMVNDLPLGDTVAIRYKETLRDLNENVSIKLDSVLNDSRCPVDVVCVWAGNAEVRFVFQSRDNVSAIILNTTLRPKDTIINGYQIKLLHLYPGPLSTHQIPARDYTADIMVQRQ